GFAGGAAFAAGQHCRHNGAHVVKPSLVECSFGGQHDIAFRGIEIGDRLGTAPGLAGLREQHETRPVPAFGQGEAFRHRRHFAFGCHSPSMAPVGSVMIENEPAFGTSMTSRITVAPSDLALAVAAATSSTRT